MKEELSGMRTSAADDRPAKCRLAVVIPVHWAEFMGGSQYQAKLLIDHLAESGQYDIAYFAHRTRVSYQPVNHRVVTTTGSARLRRYTDLSDSVSLYRALRDFNPDLIYQRAASGFTGIAAYYAKKHRRPMVWHVASDMEVVPFDQDFSLRSLPKWLQKRSIEFGLRNVSHIVVQTESQKSLLKKHYGREDATLIRNFHPSPAEIPRRDERFRVLWIANLKPIKQPELFLALADRLSDSPITFSIIGGPSTSPKWQSDMDQQIAACANVEYLGQLDQDAVNQELARSHLLVNTSKLEGFSNTFIQAWMRGVPVASLNVNPDGLLDGEMGYCANGSLDRLAEIVSELAADQAMLEALSVSVTEAAERQFSMRNAASLAEVFQSAVDSDAAAKEQEADVEYQR